MATAIGVVEHPKSLYTGTPSIPIFVMLPLGTISMENQVVEPDTLKSRLDALKGVGVDGVMVDCWWGIVEGTAPQMYNWSGYHQLFSTVRDRELKLQVVMSFHQCGGNVGDDVYIPLPKWVLTIGEENPHIFFTNLANRTRDRNREFLTFGIDNERVLYNRMALEVYREYMQSFRANFQEFLDDGTITEIEVGMGPGGELRYPSYPETQGWKYPGKGDFQCWDKYLLKSLKNAAEMQGQPTWAAGPSDAGDYNSAPQDSAFFRDGYKSPYGEFFLTWYSQTLIDHGDSVLSKAEEVFGQLDHTKLGAKVAGVHWWYKSESHAAELAAGYYNLASRNGYTPIANMLAKHKATLNFTCIELSTEEETAKHPEAQADPEALLSQVLQAAWDKSVEVACENALPCYDQAKYDRIFAKAKPQGHTLAGFTYLRLGPKLMEDGNFDKFRDFVHQMHGNEASIRA